MIDLQASIIPGSSAAGYRLGQVFAEVVTQLGTVPIWSREQPLSVAIDGSTGWLQVPLSLLTGGANEGSALLFSHGTVKLNFAPTGALYEIVLAKNYAGTLLGGVGIGSMLSQAQHCMTLEYDGGDEMYYSAEKENGGVAFYAGEETYDRDESQIIQIISVHDWSMKQ